MRPAPEVRRVRIAEWRAVRELRLEAVGDPDAALAFFTTPSDELARSDAFWRERTAGAALGPDGAQFIADAGDRWVGTVTVLVQPAGRRDPLVDALLAPRADLVGVYLAPDHRGTGLLARLVDAAAAWAQSRGVAGLTLTTHVDNHRAQAAYRRIGFAATGESVRSPIGEEIVMHRAGSVRA